MGTDDGPEDTRPKHQVYLSAFWVDKNEVSVEEYSKFLDDRPALKRPPSWTQGLKLKYPITEVSWQDAQAFCNAQGKLLPTEAQWEKAARGEDGRAYPWGNDELDAPKANSSKNPLNALWPIGSAPAGASPYGVLDMAGNAAEWVRDYYQADYYPSAPSNDPRGPDVSLGGTRGVRGGSFNYPPDLLRTFVRLGIYPEYAVVNTVGFRCVLEP
jgi:formylglycine-generating enzyme required for sulfatase activity